MSTLKVGTIQDTSAGNSSTPAEISSGRAKIWACINGTSTPAFHDSYNCTSLTDNDTGDWTLNFSITMGNTGYSASCMSENWEGTNIDSYTVLSEYYQVRTTTTMRFRCMRLRYDSQSPQFKDSRIMGITIFGDV